MRMATRFFRFGVKVVIDGAQAAGHLELDLDDSVLPVCADVGVNVCIHACIQAGTQGGRRVSSYVCMYT